MIVSTKDIYPAYQIEGNCILGKNGDITLAYSLDLPEIYSLGEKDFDGIHAELFKFVKSLSGCIIHKQDIFLKSTFNSENLPDKTFLEKATRRKFHGRAYMEHYNFLFITLPNLKSLSKSFMNSSLIKSGKVFKADRQRITIFDTQVQRAIGVLNATNFFKATPLESHDIRSVLYSYLNGFSEGKLTDVVFKPEMKIGNNFYNVYAINDINNQPETIGNCIIDTRMSSDEFKFYKSFLQPLGLDLDCNHIVNQFIYVDDHKDLKNELKKTFRQFNMFSKFSPENQSGATNIENYLKEIEENEQVRLCRAHINILVWDDTKEGLKQIDNLVVSQFREMDVVPYFSTYTDYIYYFLSSIPGNAGNMPRQETFLSDLQKAVNYLILTSNYKSDSMGLVFNDRRFNIPILRDDFYKPYESKQITARNAFIVSPTGGGKSFLLNHILRQSVEQDFIVTLVELGASYEKLFHLYPEQSAYIQYKEGEPLGINPFLLKSKDELTADKIRSLADFIFILWKKEKKEEDFERVSLYKIIQDYYQNGRYFSFPDFHAYVKDTSDLHRKLEIDKKFFDRDEFIHVTSEYAEGMFKFLLEDTRQNFYLHDKRFVGFELENIKDNMDILPIMFMMIRDVTENVIWRNKSMDKRIWFEEAAKLIKYPIMLRIMDYYFQTIRKHNGSIGIVLQSIDQIPNNEIGNAIIGNTHVFYLLQQDKSIETLRSRLNLTTHDVNQILSIQNNFSGDIRYTEFMMKMGNLSNVYRLEVPEEAYLAYLSEGKEKKQVMDELLRVGSMETAISNLIGGKK